MASETGNANQEAPKKRQSKKQEVNPLQELVDILKAGQNQEGEKIARKDEWAENLKKKDLENSKNYVKSGKHIVVAGKKVLLKMSNAAGSGYTQYMFNAKRYPEEFEKLKKDKYLMVGEEKVPLKFIDNKIIEA